MNVSTNPTTPSRVSDETTSGLTIAGILRDAATYLMRHGWTKGAYYADTHSPTPKACTLGAIGHIAGDVILTDDGPVETEPDSTLYREAVIALKNYLGLSADDSIGPWNDHPNRIRAEVVAALNEAATWWETNRSH